MGAAEALASPASFLAALCPSPGSKTGAGKFLREMLGGVSVGAMVAARWIQQCANNALAVLHYFQMEGKAHPTAGEFQ